jgi:hypothetical protein
MASTTQQRLRDNQSLWEFLDSLTRGEITPVKKKHEEPPWFAPGVVCEIDEQMCWFFLELLPPRWTHDNWFAFGEGTGPFRLFWQTRDQYFARQLTEEETVLFCKLSRTSLHL